jgi:hypothetical protein
MQFNRFLLCQAVHDEKFIQGIIERYCRARRVCEVTHIHGEYGVPEAEIYHESFIWSFAENRGVEIKLESSILLVKAPDGTGIEKPLPRRRRKVFRPLDFDGQIRNPTAGTKRFQGANKCHILRATS